MGMASGNNECKLGGIAASVWCELVDIPGEKLVKEFLYSRQITPSEGPTKQRHTTPLSHKPTKGHDSRMEESALGLPKRTTRLDWKIQSSKCPKKQLDLIGRSNQVNVLTKEVLKI
ncbi:hypothetical protein QBC37DRAFT_395994 [Rhypophila decipiens]|uniref:Uncharacterized protein n=1 Tax=Rhypophila decipiens TaxID=261697 RepID=A0AAN6YLB4_9PEZI|nr:hypothetical protein QBC37DRAFT_395994 [Rhypophila decipiens]